MNIAHLTKRRDVLWAFALVLVVAAGLIGVWLRLDSRRDVWLDEVYSLMLSRGEGYAHRSLPVGVPMASLPDALLSAPARFRPSDVWHGQRSDSHPPLYFLLLHCWRWAFGGGIEIARLFSVLMWAGSVVAAAVFGRLLGLGRKGSVLSCAVLAASTPVMWYAAEIRHYSLGVFLSVVLVGSVAVWACHPRPAWALTWSVVLVAMGLTHYFLLGVGLGAVAGAALTRGANRRHLALIMTGVLVCYAAAWGPGLADQWRVREGYTGWITEWGLLSPGFAVVLAVGAFSRVLGAPSDMTGAVSGAAILAMLAERAWHLSPDRGGVGLVLACSSLGAVLMPLISDLYLGSVHLFHIRYLLFAAAPLSLSAGALFASHGPVRCLGPGLLAVALLGQTERWTTESDWRSVAEAAASSLSVPDGQTAGVAFVVTAPDQTMRRRDVETDVRLLGVLVTANLPPAMSGARATQDRRWPVVLLEPPPDAPAETLHATTRRLPSVTRWVVISAWRYPDPGLLFDDLIVTGAQYWPEMNARVTVLERPQRR